MRWALLLVVVAGCALGLPGVPAPSADEGGRRQQELDWLVSALERRHPDIYAHTPRAEFGAHVDRVRERLPDATPAQAFLCLMEVVALVADAHTRLADLGPVEELYLPVSFDAWPGSVWVAAVQPDRPDLFARELVDLEGHSPRECLAALRPYVPHENQVQLRRGAARLLQLPQVLHAVGLTAGSESVTLRLRDLQGAESTHVLAARPRAELSGWTAFPPPEWSEPLYRSHMHEPWWWTEFPERRALYFQYNRCHEDPAAPFARTAEQLLARLDEGDLELLIVDLRHNAGGDSRILEPLLRGLGRRPRWCEAGRIDVLIGNSTFSSGMLNALSLGEDLGARLVGEPTLQKPNGFGELRDFVLPFSGLRVEHSTRTLRLVPGDPPSLEPDVLVPLTFEDLHHGRDPVLDWVLEQR